MKIEFFQGFIFLDGQFHTDPNVKFQALSTFEGVLDLNLRSYFHLN